MKKLYILVLLIAILALFKMGFDVYSLNAQQSVLNEKIDKIEKVNSTLNDQLASIQRQDIKDVSQQTNSNDNQREQNLVIQPKDMIKQQLNLVDFALKQHQFHYAMDKLLELDRQIDAFVLAPAIKNSLHQVIAKDVESIKQYVKNNEAQQQKMNQLLFQLNKELSVEITSPHLTIAQDEKKYFWEKWFTVEKVNQPVQHLMQRSIILKEAQLRIFIARSALVQGQYVQFHQEMNDVVSLLNQFPDQTAQTLIKQIQSIDAMTVLAPPTLSTRTLLG
jgi:hypothetical protein